MGCTAAEAALVAGRRQGPCGRASRLRRRGGRKVINARRAKGRKRLAI
ncbi:50S ribosomal protein L34 [Burkholderia glumae]